MPPPAVCVDHADGSSTPLTVRQQRLYHGDDTPLTGCWTPLHVAGADGVTHQHMNCVTSNPGSCNVQGLRQLQAPGLQLGFGPEAPASLA